MAALSDSLEGISSVNAMWGALAPVGDNNNVLSSPAYVACQQFLQALWWEWTRQMSQQEGLVLGMWLSQLPCG